MSLIWRLLILLRAISVSGLSPGEYYENYVLNEGQIRSLETPSVQNCIHKCQFDNQCNIANLKVITASKIQCVFARVECFEDLHEKLQQSNGWYLYKLSEKDCKARPAIGQQKLSHEKECSKGGGFKIEHVGSGKCLRYDQMNDRIALHEGKTYGDKFCVTGNGYLKQIASGRCFKKVEVYDIERIALDGDCTSNNANFYFYEGKICYQSEEIFLVTTNNINIITGMICEDETKCQFKLIWS